MLEAIVCSAPRLPGRSPAPRRVAPELPYSPGDITFDGLAGIVLVAAETRPRVDAPPCELGALICRLRSRDATALGALHAACGARLFASALRIVLRPEHAHDVVSSTWLQVWQQAAEFDGIRGSVMTWLLMIVRSRALDLLRQAKVRGKLECALTDEHLEACADGAPSPCGLAERREVHVVLRRALASLSPIQRQILTLTFLDGQSQEEAATHIGMPLGTVKSHARRGIAALRGHAALRAAHA